MFYFRTLCYVHFRILVVIYILSYLDNGVMKHRNVSFYRLFLLVYFHIRNIF